MKQITVTIPRPVETHQLPMDKFSLKALGLDVPENAGKGFIITKNNRNCMIILGKDVCDRLTLDHKIIINSDFVHPQWGHSMDVRIGRDGSFGLGSEPLTHIRINFLDNPSPNQLKRTKVQIQKAITAQGLFEIEVEEIIPEADYDPQDEEDDLDDDPEYDEDEPFF